jgi:Tol biopolymer transport system component
VAVVVGVAVALVSALLVGGARSANQASGLIAFARADGIYVMRADGSGVRALRRSGAGGVVGMAWSPSGRKLAFIANGALRVMEADGSHLVRLVGAHDGRLQSLMAPTWSADGQRIAFSAHRSGEPDRDIWIVNADGSNLRRLARTPDMWECDVDWSPVGGRIAFSEVAGYFLKLYVMKTNGSQIRRLAPKSLSQGRTFQAAAPDWSPGGRRIAFTGWRGSILNAEIVVMEANGGSRVWLTNDDVPDRDPVWSPDGTGIAFVRGGTGLALDAPVDAHGSSEIFVMNADGTGVTRLTHDQVGEASPAWQPIAGAVEG